MNVRACSFLIFGRWHITVFACLKLKFILEMTQLLDIVMSMQINDAWENEDKLFSRVFISLISLFLFII